jgi:putative pyruvate formate lyase activating enzyme
MERSCLVSEAAKTRQHLAERAVRARSNLAACTLCERRCKVNRLAGETAPCGLAGESRTFKRHMSFGEEIELLPSYLFYFSGCNFRCRFCVQAPTCFAGRSGMLVGAHQAAAEFRRVVDSGARTINLLGGEPSLHLATILDIATASEHPLPLVLNSNMYMTPMVLELLDGVVETIIGDFKFGNDTCAKRLAGVDRYFHIVTRNLRIATKQAPLIVRHLVMPGHLECCLRPVAEWLADNLPDVRLTLMTGYVPPARSNRDAPMRCLTDDERNRAIRIVEECSLDWRG